MESIASVKVLTHDILAFLMDFTQKGINLVKCPFMPS